MDISSKYWHNLYIYLFNLLKINFLDPKLQNKIKSTLFKYKLYFFMGIKL